MAFILTCKTLQSSISYIKLSCLNFVDNHLVLFVYTLLIIRTFMCQYNCNVSRNIQRKCDDSGGDKGNDDTRSVTIKAYTI